LRELGIAAEVVDIELLPSATGYRILDRVGGVFCFGEATFPGSIPSTDASVGGEGAVAFASTPSGLGYWILDGAGGVFSFGDAGFFGSVPSLRLDGDIAPAVDIVATATGEGYWILEADGNVRGFGDAARLGPARAERPIDAVALASTPGDAGYLVADRRGFIFPVGLAPIFGSAAGLVLSAPVVDLVVLASRRSAV
jgi:hypothetical protein